MGFIYLMIAIACWGIMPVAAKGALQAVDDNTVNFCRFAVAAVTLGLLLGARAPRLILPRLHKHGYLLFGMAVVGLLVNHILFVVALNYIPAGASQALAQVGPIALLLVSVFVLKEPFARRQWLGTLTFIVGLGLFFNLRLTEIFWASSDYALGVWTMVLGSLLWTLFGLGQKLLIGEVRPTVLLFYCYLCGTIVLLPAARLGSLAGLNGEQYLLLGLSSLVSLTAYICFGQALKYWDASRVSAVLASVPLSTLLFEKLFAVALPDYVTPVELNFAAWFGVAMVVAGCLLASWSKPSAATQK